MNAPVAPGGWGAIGPNSTASRTPVHDSTGSGGAKRLGPSVGAAYGTPRNSRTPSAARPRTGPAVVVTTGTTGGVTPRELCRIGRMAPTGRRVRDAPPSARVGVQLPPLLVDVITEPLAAASRENDPGGRGQRSRSSYRSPQETRRAPRSAADATGPARGRSS